MTTISPYAGSINLTQRTGIALYQKGCKALPIKFDRLAKSLPSFLAALNLRATMCQWTNILTIEDDGNTPRHMITHHGSLTQANVDMGVTEWKNNAAKPQPPAVGHITEVEAQTIIKSKMLFNCLRESLTNTYLTSLTVILPTMEEDGPKFLYYMITKTHVTMVLSTCDLLEDINTLDFKKHRYDVLKLHAAFDSLVAQLTANKAEPSELNQMMYLLQAYKTNSSNETFLRHVDNLESDWSRGVITTPAELRTKVETYINTLIRNKQWKSTRPAPTQPTALVTDETAKPGASGKQTDDKDAIAKLKAKNAAWKFDRSKLSGKTYTKNEKTYHWCTGPGHSKVGMWVIHEPGTCTGSTKPKGNTPQANTAETGTGTSGTQGNRTKKAQFKAHIAQVLASANTFGDDTTDLVNKILSEYKWLLSQWFSLTWLLYWPTFFRLYSTYSHYYFHVNILLPTTTSPLLWLRHLHSLLPFTSTTLLNAPLLDASLLARRCKPAKSSTLIKFSTSTSRTTYLCGCHLYDTAFLCSLHRYSTSSSFSLAMYLPQVRKMPFSPRTSTSFLLRLL